MTGDWPEGEIDHIDGNKVNNRFANLRLADHTLNVQNVRAPRAHNNGGHLGASLDKRSGKWRGVITVGGRSRYLGTFATPQEASAAYLEAKRLLHPGCTL